MSARGTKRARTSGVRVARPIEKDLIVVNQEGIAGTQVQVNLKVHAFPATIVGLRWSLSCIQDAGTALSQLTWAIVVLPDGNTTANNMSATNGSSMYQPEQQVLAFGNASGTGADLGGPTQFDGTTKTMRKLRSGDRIAFIALAEATNTYKVFGTVQFFSKT